MRGKLFKLTLLALAMFASTDKAFAANVPQNDLANSHKPVATILPEAGKLVGDDGVLHQGLAFECEGGKIGGLSYYSPENDLDVSINAPVNIEVIVDGNDSVTFTAVRTLNKKAPSALTSKSDDVDLTIQLIHNLEITENDVKVKVSNPVEGKNKVFRLKGSDMKGKIKSFRAYCDVK